jgi:hypothetical protein
VYIVAIIYLYILPFCPWWLFLCHLIWYLLINYLKTRSFTWRLSSICVKLYRPSMM